MRQTIILFRQEPTISTGCWTNECPPVPLRNTGEAILDSPQGLTEQQQGVQS